MQDRPTDGPQGFAPYPGLFPPAPPRKQSTARTVIVVISVGSFLLLLVAVAIPVFTHLTSSSRTSEVSRNIASIYVAEVVYYNGDPPPYGLSPSLLPPRQFLTCPQSPAERPTAVRHVGDWTGNWTSLSFATDTPVYYTYQVTASGTYLSATATITAHGDLDGNGVLSTFQRALSINSVGDVVGSPLTITNELE